MGQVEAKAEDRQKVVVAWHGGRQSRDEACLRCELPMAFSFACMQKCQGLPRVQFLPTHPLPTHPPGTVTTTTVSPVVLSSCSRPCRSQCHVCPSSFPIPERRRGEPPKAWAMPAIATFLFNREAWCVVGSARVAQKRAQKAFSMRDHANIAAAMPHAMPPSLPAARPMMFEGLTVFMGGEGGRESAPASFQMPVPPLSAQSQSPCPKVQSTVRSC